MRAPSFFEGLARRRRVRASLGLTRPELYPTALPPVIIGFAPTIDAPTFRALGEIRQPGHRHSVGRRAGAGLLVRLAATAAQVGAYRGARKRRGDRLFRQAGRAPHPGRHPGGRALCAGLCYGAGSPMADGWAAAGRGGRSGGDSRAGGPRIGPRRATAAHPPHRRRRPMPLCRRRTAPLMRRMRAASISSSPASGKPAAGVHPARLPAAAVERGGFAGGLPAHVPRPHHVLARRDCEARTCWPRATGRKSTSCSLGRRPEPQPGSNAWALAGSRTASGKPLLSNDMHLEYSLPGIWYMAHLQAPGLDVSGVALPGAPGVIVGHNQRIAWGMTNLEFDVQDLYIEKFDDRTGRYLVPRPGGAGARGARNHPREGPAPPPSSPFG